jgi:hypothetical protein
MGERKLSPNIRTFQFWDWEYVHVTNAPGMPPEKYFLTYAIYCFTFFLRQTIQQRRQLG